MKASCFVLVISGLLLAACSTPPVSTGIPATPVKKSIDFSSTVVSLTFDDGAADNYLARPVLARYGLHATFYVVSGFTGTEGYMTAEQLTDLYRDGSEIGGHTLSHTKLTEVRGVELRREICQDRLNLLAFGFEAASFAYPFGHYDDEARQAVASCGYNSARGVTDGPDSVPPVDAYVLRAMPYIVSDTDVSKLLRYVTGVASDGGGWVILVFHRICDGCDPYSVDLDTFTRFAGWLAQQRDARGLVIRTVSEVIGGVAQPGVMP
jgi:peptidoglycan/xylan/chitin deacetylase (PgdA/CDA1 family)